MKRRINRKINVNHKRRILYFSVLIMLFFISIGYSYMNTSLSINSHVKLSAITNINQIVQHLPTSCVYKYEGEVTDQVGQTVSASNVYFNKCADKRNVIFGGYCWQIIRTTETGGTKMIYNGEPVNGKCESNRNNHLGIVQSNASIEVINSSYLYGGSFTYDGNSGNFVLTDTLTATWSDSTYENLLGKFTCMSATNTCSTLYEINSYVSDTSANLSSYTIANTNYAQIGTSSFNAGYKNPAMVGYMFNKVYDLSANTPTTTTYKFGNSFTYNNGTYTLSGTTQNITNWSTQYNLLSNTHYTCWNSSGTCSEISFVFYTSDSSSNYINLSGGKSINDVLTEMLSNNDVNRYNSSIKGIIDNWYAKNLSSMTNLLEDTVYCNDRSINNYGGYDPNSSTSEDYLFRFKNYYKTSDLSCTNITDQFAVSNNKALLTYPVALLTATEGHNIDNPALMATGDNYWRLSPSFVVFYTRNRYLTNGGSSSYEMVNNNYGIRPVITLNNSNNILSGTGSEVDPWIIDTTPLTNTIGTYNAVLKNTYLSDTYRNNIKTITLQESINISGDAVISWDISALQDGSVMAYLKTNSTDNTMYDLYIQGNGGLKANPDSSRLFNAMYNLEQINNLAVLDTSGVKNMSYLFAASYNLTSLDVSSFNTSNVTNMSYMFGGAYLNNQVDMRLNNIIGLNSFDTSKVTTMNAMFFNCPFMHTIDISNFDTHNVTDMTSLFNNSNNFNSVLETIVFGPDFDTSNVEYMRLMFADNVNLINFDISNFNTSKVRDMSYMFGRLRRVTSLNLTHFDVSRVEDFHCMFFDMSNLFDLNISNWNISNATNINGMFYQAISLKNLNLSSFDFNNVNSFSNIFRDMPTKSAGAYVRVKNATARNWILGLSGSDRPSDWDTANVIIVS